MKKFSILEKKLEALILSRVQEFDTSVMMKASEEGKYIFSLINLDEAKLKQAVTHLQKTAADLSGQICDGIAVEEFSPPCWHHLESWDEFDKDWLRAVHIRLADDQHYADSFSQWQQKIGTMSETFTLWGNYLYEDAPLFELFRIAVKTGDMKLRTWLRMRILPIDAATSKMSKYEFLHITELWDLLFEWPPVVLKHFLEGGFAARYKNADDFALWPLDEVQEDANKGCKSGSPSNQHMTVKGIIHNSSSNREMI